MAANTIKIGLAIELLLECVGGIFPSLGLYLPLGGSHLAQIGVALGVAVAVSELHGAFAPAITLGRPWRHPTCFPHQDESTGLQVVHQPVGSVPRHDGVGVVDAPLSIESERVR
jgi:hypothetical protein